MDQQTKEDNENNNKTGKIYMNANWYDREVNGMTNDAFAVITSLASGVNESEVAEDTGIDNSLIQQWLADPEFVSQVNSRRIEIEESIKNDIEIESMQIDKKGLLHGFDLKCSVLFFQNTEKEKLALSEKYLSAIKEVILKACVTVHEKQSKKLKKTKKILMESIDEAYLSFESQEASVSSNSKSARQ
jgi:hypothetical protein